MTRQTIIPCTARAAIEEPKVKENDKSALYAFSPWAARRESILAIKSRLCGHAARLVPVWQDIYQGLTICRAA